MSPDRMSAARRLGGAAAVTGLSSAGPWDSGAPDETLVAPAGSSCSSLTSRASFGWVLPA